MNYVHSNYIAKWWGKILHIYDPIFMQNFYFVKAVTEEEFAKIIEKVVKINPRDRKPDAGFRVIASGKKGSIEVCLLWGSSLSLLSHEISHAVHYVLSRKGMTLDDNTTEVYAYYQQFLTRVVGEKAFGLKKQ